MRVVYTVGVEDAVASGYVVVRRRSRSDAFFPYERLGVAGAAWFGAMACAAAPDLMPVAVVLLLFGAAYPALGPSRARRDVEAELRRHALQLEADGRLGLVSLTLADDGFVEEDLTERRGAAWSEVRGVTESNGRLFIFVRDWAAVVPSLGFRDPDEFLAVRRFVRERIRTR